MAQSSSVRLAEVSWERMIRAVEKVRERLMRATEALDRGGIAYAVIEGHAVAAWVSRIDEAAVRNTQDVDLLLRRSDLDAAAGALGHLGFVHQNIFGEDVFLDGPQATVRDAVHVIVANERVNANDVVPAPGVEESELSAAGFRVLLLEPLVRMKLTSHRLKDQVHVQDMIGVGLIDQSWVARFPPELAARLQKILDNPNG
jgi:hypothetical protein